jgi:Tfp pilus assembly protein PilX
MPSRFRPSPDDDRGAAIITVLLLLTVLSGVASTLVLLTNNNLQSASRDRQAIGALATADGGVAQALEYLRMNGAGSVTCTEASAKLLITAPASVPATDPCRTNPAGWTSPVTPTQVNTSSGGTCTAGATCYTVHLTAIERYNPPAVKVGTYRIHSRGVFGGGPATRAVSVDVKVKPMTLPIGVFGKELDGNGGTVLYDVSLFTTDCVSPRWDGSGNGTRFTGGLDPFWDEPAAANSVATISTGTNCAASGNIHKDGVVCPSSSELHYDRDSEGGALPVGSPCGSYYNAAGELKTRTTTKFTYDDLRTYGYRPGGLTDRQYEALRIRASSQNLLNVTPDGMKIGLDAAVAAGINNPVVYIDNLAATANFSFKESHVPAAFHREPGGACHNRAVLIVVRNAGMIYQSGNSSSSWRSMSLLVPEGSYRGNGGYNVLGTLFANNISLGGNEQFRLDDCYVDNMPGALLDLDVVSFREDDRGGTV